MTTREHAEGRRGWARRILALILSLGISLGLAELGLRKLRPLHLSGGLAKAYRYDKELGYAPPADLDLLVVTDFQQEIHTNRLATFNWQDDFGGYDQLVFALGDSYTQGVGLPADASYPFQLDLILNVGVDRRYQKRFGVVNLGLAAYGGAQSLVTLERYASIIGKPSVVLYVGSDNDHEDDLLFASGYRHRHMVSGSPTWEPFVRPLQWAGNLEIVKRAKIGVGKWRRSAIRNRAGLTQNGSQRPVSEMQWPAISRIATKAEAYDALFVVAWANAPGDSYRWLKNRAEREGVTFADWWPAVQSVRDAIPAVPLTNPHSGGHLRTWVNYRIAVAFAEVLKPALCDVRLDEGAAVIERY